MTLKELKTGVDETFANPERLEKMLNYVCTKYPQRYNPEERVRAIFKDAETLKSWVWTRWNTGELKDFWNSYYGRPLRNGRWWNGDVVMISTNMLYFAVFEIFGWSFASEEADGDFHWSRL